MKVSFNQKVINEGKQVSSQEILNHNGNSNNLEKNKPNHNSAVEQNHEKEFENVRISDELLRNSNIFVSDIIQTEHVKFDKSLKSYFITLDSELVKAFSNLLKLSTFNNILCINSVMDFYIMQIIVLEYNVRYNNAYKENLESDFKLLDENFKIKEDEVNFLRNRIASLEGGSETEELFYQEINKIRDLLREKTTELIKLDQFHNQTHNENKDKVNKFKEQNALLIDENEKMKEILKDILGFHSKGQKKDLDNLLNYLGNNNTLFNENNEEQINENNLNNAQDESESKELNSNNNANNNSISQKEEFTEKVLNEFDKIFSDELKRVERFFKKDSSNNNKTIESLKRKGSYRRKGSAEKNYFEWKSKSQNETWAETLRGRDPQKKPSHNNLNHFGNENNQQSNVDIENMVEHTKNRLRNSLKSYENLHLNVGSTNNLNSNFNFMSSFTTKNIMNDKQNNNFYFGKENNIHNPNANFSSRDLNNMHLREDGNSVNNYQMQRNNSNSNISSGIKSRVNQSKSPNNRNASMKHSSSKKEVKGREGIEATLRNKLFKKK